MKDNKVIALVIPCFKVDKHILNVLKTVPDFIDHIVVVDDACPQFSGRLAQEKFNDSRLNVIFHEKNAGVGGAVVSGFKKALELNADIVVKIDGDGQMPAEIMHEFIQPILNREADYAKGNRFFWPAGLKSMPMMRKLGNTGLSFINKLSSGYWDIMDPTNGYFAINNFTLKNLEMDKLSKRYFFESDMLFRLGIIRAVVQDIPMNAVYGDEKSNLKISNSFVTFLKNHLVRINKRLIYIYFLRDFNQGSLSLIFSSLLLCFSVIFASIKWYVSIRDGVPTALGTMFLAVLPFIIGFQLLLNFLNYDVNNKPTKVLGKL